MHLDLTDVIRDPGLSVEKPIDIPAGPLDEFELTEPVTGWVRASNARKNIVVRGHASTAVQLECARCLKEYSQPLEFGLDVVVPVSTFNDLLGAARVSADDDDSGLELTAEDIALLFSEHMLNVNELVRQAIVVHAPIQPLCAPDCAGLPEAALYKAPTGDPRWDALQKLNGQNPPSGEHLDSAEGDE